MKKAVHSFRQRLGLTIMPRCCRDEVYRNEETAVAARIAESHRKRIREGPPAWLQYAKAWAVEDTARMDQLEATARDQGIIFERKDRK